MMVYRVTAQWGNPMDSATLTTDFLYEADARALYDHLLTLPGLITLRMYHTQNDVTDRLHP